MEVNISIHPLLPQWCLSGGSQAVHSNPVVLRPLHSVQKLSDHAFPTPSVTVAVTFCVCLLSLLFFVVGGSEPFRSYWEVYVSRGMLLIFVVDSADHNRLPEAKKYLHRLIKINPIIPLVVFANKQVKICAHIICTQ